MGGGRRKACRFQVKTPRPCGKGLRGWSLVLAVSSSSKTDAGRRRWETEGQGSIMQADILSDSARLTDAEWQRVCSTGAYERTANMVFLFAGYYLWKPWLRPTKIRWKIGFTVKSIHAYSANMKTVSLSWQCFIYCVKVVILWFL